jgi:hypothetical protein
MQQLTTLSAEEFQAVQRIFKQIAIEPWFSRDGGRQQKFGAFLVRAYQAGNTDLVHLHDLALRTARERFTDTAAA